MSNHLKKNTLLTNMYAEKSVGDFGIGQAIAPLIKSRGITGEYYVVDRTKSDVRAEVNIERAPGAPSERIERKDRTLDNYRCVDHSLTEEIPIELLDEQEFEIIEEQMQTANDILAKIQTAHERKVHSIAWASNLAGFKTLFGTNNAFTPSTKWNAAGGNMKADILELRSRVYKATGKRPNVMVIPDEVFNVIATSDNEIRDAIKYVQKGIVTLDILAQYFEIPKVIVPSLLVDSPTAGISDGKDFLWKGDHVSTYYVDTASLSKRKQTFATTFYYDNARSRWMQVETGYNKDTKSNELNMSAYFTVKTIDNECGGALADVLT